MVPFRDAEQSNVGDVTKWPTVREKVLCSRKPSVQNVNSPGKTPLLSVLVTWKDKLPRRLLQHSPSPCHLSQHAHWGQDHILRGLTFQFHHQSSNYNEKKSCGNTKLSSFLQRALLRLAIKAIKKCLSGKNKRQRKLELFNYCQSK